MADQITETVVTRYGSRILNSLKRVILGVILFVISFCLLYWNEGQVDLSKIAKTATEISSSAASANPALKGRLISTTGVVSSSETIGDNLYLMPGKYIAIKRKVEMYSWSEKSESNTNKNLGGSETTKTNYTYAKVWKEDPEKSDKFKETTGHENPKKSLENYETKIMTAKIGIYSFDPQSITLPQYFQIPLDSNNITLDGTAIITNDNYVFVSENRAGTESNPQIGDLRVSYFVLTPGFGGTVFGKLNGSQIEPYFDQQKNLVYRLFMGTRDQGIHSLHSAYTTQLWIFRLIGFSLMWVGMMLFFGPISVMLDILPVFGSLSGFLIIITTFVASAILSIVTILVSMVTHNFVVLTGALILMIGAFLVLLVKKRKKQSPETITVPVSTVQATEVPPTPEIADPNPAITPSTVVTPEITPIVENPPIIPPTPTIV